MKAVKGPISFGLFSLNFESFRDLGPSAAFVE